MNKMKKTTAEIATLFSRVGKLITASIELDDVLDGIMEEVELYFNPAYWSLLRYDDTANHLYFSIVKGVDQAQVEEIKLKIGEGIAGHVAKTKKPIFVPDTSTDKRFCDIVDQATGFTTQSIIAVPCIKQDKLFGVIELINEEIEIFSEEDAIILSTIGDFAAIAFDNSLLYEQTLQRSFLDPLTGLYNNMKLQELEEHCKDEKKRQRKDDDTGKILVTFMDCNNFKMINDVYGHRAGDRMLKKIASSLRKVFRQHDIIIRTGGDEFTAIISLKEDEDGSETAEKIAGRLKSLAWKTKDEEGGVVTISYGFAAGPETSLRKLIHEADSSMYEHKEQIKKQGTSIQ